MITTQLRFESFLNEKAYCQLQMDFLKYDEDYPSVKRQITEPEKNLSVKGPVLFTYEDEKLSHFISGDIFFEKDFLLPSIKEMGKNHLVALLKEAKEEGFYPTKEGRDVFAQKKISKLRKYREKINEATFIKKPIVRNITNQLINIEDELYSWITTPEKDFKKKLYFNLIREDVIYFFYLLRKNEMIADMKDYELGSIIDNICYCKKSENSNAYTSIKKSRAPLNDYKNNHSDSVEEVIKRLKKYINNDFFNH